MRMLVIGSGGREHALCWAISASPMLTKLWCAPGNPGIAQQAELVPIPAGNIPELVAFARAQAIDVVVPGPEAPLVAGITDALEQAGIACVGPSGAASAIEGSKSFAKEMCEAAGIPTARWERFDDPAAARELIQRRGMPIVVKADGLAAGKGVVVAAREEEALAAVNAFMEARVLGQAGAAVVIEECLQGEEVSFFALCDGEAAIPLGAAQDHKRVGEGDTGPNTGGMGAYAPPPHFPRELQQATMIGIVRPALAELARRGTPFRGILFAGLMLTAEGVKLIEFNARFGDPECQALLLRLRSDLLPALLAAHDGELSDFDLRWSDEASIAVVLAARGYPGSPRLGGEIRGIDRALAVPDIQVFHAGTALAPDGRLIAAGGRVLTVCATGRDLRTARDIAYQGVRAIDWPDGFYRQDIGWRALASG
ncbi:MAG: phosphoribosylamine--glycine ligase [Acetobacteraceae bacterium]|nr:phosphoribosylamine--glycine ligase [Acetobacteraceae bacterium]